MAQAWSQTPSAGGTRPRLRASHAVWLILFVAAAGAFAFYLINTTLPEKSQPRGDSSQTASATVQPSTPEAPIDRSASDARPTPAEPPASVNNDTIQELKLPEQESKSATTAEPIGRERTSQIALAPQEAKVKIEPAAVEPPSSASLLSGTVILGAVPARTDDASKVATKQLVSALSTSLQIKGITVDELGPSFYTSGHFGALLKGDTSVLSQQRSADRMRAALLLTVTAACHSASEHSAAIRCTLTVQQQTIGPTGHRHAARQWTRIGVGTTAEQATLRATELLVERHADWLDGA